jgi:hypothetical protein
MGTTGRMTAVDPQALPIAAARFDAAADILLTALRTHLAQLARSRSHPAVEELVSEVARWESAARDVAAALRTAADRYAESEARGAAALR